MAKVYFLFIILACIAILVSEACCGGGKNKDKKRKSQVMEKTEGDLHFHQVKLARDLDLHSKTRQALATEIAEYTHKQDPWNINFNTNHGIEPVANYFSKKIKKNHQNVKDLIFAKKLPGPQTVEDLKIKMKLPHNYEE